MLPKSAAAASVPHRRLVVAVALEKAAGDELARVSWARTVWRLAVEPGQHPWRPAWRLRHHGALAVVAAAVVLLLLLAASGCASAPRQSILRSVPAPVPAKAARCETLLVSQELQVPLAGRIGDLRLTIDGLPEVAGKLRVLVRRPRFASTLDFEADRAPEFDKVVELSPGAGQRQLTIVLGRPPGAPDDWPRRSCVSCRVDVELSGLFDAREGLDAFFSRATAETIAIESAFRRQAPERGSRPDVALRQLADDLAAESNRCGAPIGPLLLGAVGAIDQLDAARVVLYGGETPQLPDAPAVLRSWESATAALDALPVAAAAARGAGWPASLRARSAGRLRVSALHLELAAQVAGLPAGDKPIAAQWIALAMAPDRAALDRRKAALPRIRDLSDAEARLDWVNPRLDVPVRVPGLSRPATLRVREWPAPPEGRRCIGRLGAAPVRDPDGEARAVAALLDGDPGHGTVLASAHPISALRARLQRSRELLCEPVSADVGSLFAGLEEKELGLVAERLESIYAELDRQPARDEISRAVSARTGELLCKLFDPETIQRRVKSVTAYKIFVEGGTHVLGFSPRPLSCGGQPLSAREVRQRLREAYRAALDQHGVTNRLCPVRAGKCPEDIAASVRKLFSLSHKELAVPAAQESRALDFPPPFGFSESFVQKLDRCARDACEALERLRSEAPAGQFDGPVCAPRNAGVEQPQEVTLDRPEAPSTVTLSSCDPNVSVRVTLRRKPQAGTLVAIASSHQFRYGSESVSRQGRHPQLGRIYERVADLADPGDVSHRGEGEFDVALTPTVENQVFYFFSLRRRDY
ncbi:MAG: hypothetical protein ACJ79H_18900 [Myxococcales bacterium]